MVEIFDTAQFKAALPKQAVSLGAIGGQMVWDIPLEGARLEKGEIVIRIYSGIDPVTGLSRATGRDSIRCVLFSPKTNRPITKAGRTYVTRLPGWDERLLDLLRKLYALGRKSKCPSGHVMQLLRVKKEGPNRGRYFWTCRDCDKFVAWEDAL